MERTGRVLSRRLKQRADMVLLRFRQTHLKIVWGWGKNGEGTLSQSRGKERGVRVMEEKAGSEGGFLAVCMTSQHCAGTSRREHHYMSLLSPHLGN